MSKERRALPARIELAVTRRVRNEGVLVGGRLVVAPYGNWRRMVE